MRRSDMQLLRQAIEHQWKIPEEVFQHLGTTVAKLVFSPSTADRTRLAAMKILLAIDRNNLEWAKIEAASEIKHEIERDVEAAQRIAEIAQDLGLEDVARKAIAITTAIDTEWASTRDSQAKS